MPDLPLEIAPAQVKQRLDSGDKVRLIDVREPFEHQQASIAGAQLIPMRTIPSNLSALKDGDGLLIILCHHGMRSLQVVQWLREHGLSDCQSMSGGIDEWSREIDPAVPRYY